MKSHSHQTRSIAIRWITVSFLATIGGCQRQSERSEPARPNEVTTVPPDSEDPTPSLAPSRADWLNPVQKEAPAPTNERSSIDQN